MLILKWIPSNLFRYVLSVSVVLVALCGNDTLAQEKSDSLSVIVAYPCGIGNISEISGNIIALDHFINELDSLCLSPDVTPIRLLVVSSTSPEGSIMANKALSSRRNRSLVDYMNRRSETFRNISTSLECERVEKITNHLFVKTEKADYPSLRYSRMTLFYRVENKDTVLVAVAEDKDEVSSSPLPELIEETVSEVEETVSVKPEDASGEMTISKPVLFIKTNLLYDLMTAVNASVEIPLAKRFSVEATLVYPWWRSEEKHKTLQMCYLAVTPRYYFGKSDDPYTSLFAGLTVGSGIYDLQWTLRGVQGSFWHVSPVIGYSHYIAKRWKMEYSASIGFIQTKYAKYTQTSDTEYGEIKVKDYPWTTKVLNTVLPTSLNVSIIYSFTKTKHIRQDER